MQRNIGDYCDTTEVVIKVYHVSGSSLVPSNGLFACPGSGVVIQQDKENVIATYPAEINPRDADRYFCFTGYEKNYYLQVGNGVKYKWLAENLRSSEGVYDITEFGATRDTTINNTYSLKNAVFYIGSRPESGGLLTIPNGVFKVTGNPSPAAFGESATLPIVLPPGITLTGTNGKINFASSRIQMDSVVGGAGTVFKIGACTSFVSLKNFGIVTPLDGTSYRDNSIAIYVAGGDETNSQPSHHAVFSGLSIQGFKEGISVYGEDPDHGWQFDSVKVENSQIADCLYPIHNATWNSDWLITNTNLGTMNNSGNTVRGRGIWIERGGMFTLDNVLGGAPKVPGSVENRALRPEAFIYISGPGSLNIRGSGSEETAYSIIYDNYNYFQDTERDNLTITGSIFGDPILIKRSLAFVSMGNRYLSDSVQVNELVGGSILGDSSATQIYSYGDSFSGVTYKRKLCPGLSYGLTLPEASAADCRRDFYIYNGESQQNSVVIKTSQRSVGTNDSDSLDHNSVQSPFRIVGPPTYDANATGDKFKYFGYTLRRGTDSNTFLEFEGNNPSSNGFRFFGSIYPSVDNQFEFGNASKRWSLVRAVTITPGDIILSDRVSGRELYRINEDENSIFFSDIRTGKQLMRLDRDGNLVVTGRVFEQGNAPKKPTRKWAAAKRGRRW